MPRTPTRVLLASLTSLALCLGLGGLATPASAEPAAGPSPVPVTSRADLDTNLTLNIGRCEGCVVTMVNNDGINPIYSSVPRTVVDGSVTVTVPTAVTDGLSVQVQVPWAGYSDLTTNVVWRYSSTSVGDRIGFGKARSKRRASGCWAGTVNEFVELDVKVRRVRVAGQPGAIAWSPTTQSYLRPMKRTRRGVLATQDALACKVPATRGR